MSNINISSSPPPWVNCLPSLPQSACPHSMPASAGTAHPALRWPSTRPVTTPAAARWQARCRGGRRRMGAGRSRGAGRLPSQARPWCQPWMATCAGARATDPSWTLARSVCGWGGGDVCVGGEDQDCKVSVWVWVWVGVGGGGGQTKLALSV